VPLSRVLRRIRAVREERYSLFKGFFRGASDDAEGLDEAQLPRLLSIQVCAGAAAIGHSLGEIKLDDLGVELKAVRRHHIRRSEVEPEFEVMQDDVLVVLGTPEQLALAETRVLQG
jgi:CPA2 family monovalent cation:H+ antiporter-2